MWLNFEKEEMYNFSAKDAIVDSFMFSMIIDSTVKCSSFTEEGENDIDTIHINFIGLQIRSCEGGDRQGGSGANGSRAG
ncbi:hypothetical protein QCA50_002561 [Cerrena zonata]|uniref:Uncharacterized protein n=1 Tax=Cerrena zonata TaxID=2478898 RepID=A0AAW0GK33_9APHY